ncbi:MAG: DUF4233 domain-containing protein [Actinomycetales bacterium]|nr:DUF4233 domain-containing protein [Actinomycetales bacterium]
MKVLGTAVLAMEIIVMVLAVPIAATNGSLPDTRTAIIGAVAIMLVLIVAIGALRRGPRGIWLGWAAQVLVLACGFVVPMMFIVGGIFAVLWFVALRLGRRVESAQ